MDNNNQENINKHKEQTTQQSIPINKHQYSQNNKHLIAINKHEK